MSELPKQGANRRVPTLIRGKLYPSMTAAAKDLGVRIETVRRNIERGTPDAVGLHPYSGCKQPGRYGNPSPKEGN